jgi:hypothetical protein
MVCMEIILTQPFSSGQPDEIEGEYKKLIEIVKETTPGDVTELLCVLSIIGIPYLGKRRGKITGYILYIYSRIISAIDSYDLPARLRMLRSGWLAWRQERRKKAWAEAFNEKVRDTRFTGWCPPSRLHPADLRRSFAGCWYV